MLAATAAAWTAAHDRDTYREDLAALIDTLLADASAPEPEQAASAAVGTTDISMASARDGCRSSSVRAKRA